MSTKENPTGGVKAFSIAGRLIRRRERLTSITDDERRWRAQWLKDQVISPEEPRYVPEYYKSTNNIFRRIWQFPAQQFEAILTPPLGKNGAHLARLLTSTTIKFVSTIYIVGYFFKYHSNDFSRYRSWEVHCPRGRIYPDEPDYPNYVRKTPQQYLDHGFYSSPLAKQV